MTTEREMLEYASKACGIELIGFAGVGCWRGEEEEWGYQTKDFDRWNPLTNNADCAAMCAKLDINTFFYLTIMRVECSAEDAGDEQTIRHSASYNGTDEGKEAAWRYAATMVAANIGGKK